MPDLSECDLCPRECRADRIGGQTGFCSTDAELSAASICVHRGEEPVISGEHGICNVFFSHCNMQCVYCQNFQISRNDIASVPRFVGLESIVGKIESELARGCQTIGFVSPSHMKAQVRAIIKAIRERGYYPTAVYNTNAYEKTEAIASLETWIDVWLPDLKYMDDSLGRTLSDTPDYPGIAAAAIKEMYRQKGADLQVDVDGRVISGLIVRHLVLPGYIENSKAVLRWIAEHLSPLVHISIMSQYSPTPQVADHPNLGRRLRPKEYDEVLEELERLGFCNGWTQDLDSAGHYLPDFDAGEHPFEGR